MTPGIAPADIELCRALTKKHGTSYYLATLLFPRELRRATYALYAFVRVPDEVVDTESAPQEARERLERLRAQFHAACNAGTSDDPVMRAAAWVFAAYAIPREYADAFYDAMLLDTHKTRYETYQELDAYMYGSAAVVGLMMTHIIGYSSDQAFRYAQDLGRAMQLTNFLRDIGEDYAQRGRIYLPQEDMHRFGVSDADIAAGTVTDSFRQLMRFEIQRARSLYAAADPGIALLDRRGRKAVMLARVLYSRILDAIEAADYDVFSARRRTTGLEKLYYSLPIIFSKS